MNYMHGGLNNNLKNENEISKWIKKKKKRKKEKNQVIKAICHIYDNISEYL